MSTRLTALIHEKLTLQMEPTLIKEILWYPFDERFQTGVTSLYFPGTLLANPTHYKLP